MLNINILQYFKKSALGRDVPIIESEGLLWEKELYGGYKKDWYEIIKIAQFCQFPTNLWKYTCEMDKY